MQTIDELATELKLSDAQKTAVQNYISLLVVELLESIKEDNISNFDETISSLKTTS